MPLTADPRLEEFLKRRARLQRVEEEVRRRIVLGFFETLYWSRQFRRHMDRKRAGRMEGVPQFGVPDIYVDDNEGSGDEGEGDFSGERGSKRRYPARNLRVEDAAAGQSSNNRSSWGSSPRNSADRPYQHPLGAPRTAPSSPTHHQQSGSAFSFDLQTQPGEQAGTGRSGGDVRRQTSVGGPSGVQDMLDDSVWVESLRRSATIRRSPRGSYRYGGQD